MILIIEHQTPEQRAASGAHNNYVSHDDYHVNEMRGSLKAALTNGENMFSLQLTEAMDDHLQMASAARGLSKGEYTRLALAVALNAEPVVTPQVAAMMRAMKQGKTKAEYQADNKLVDA